MYVCHHVILHVMKISRHIGDHSRCLLETLRTVSQGYSPGDAVWVCVGVCRWAADAEQRRSRPCTDCQRGWCDRDSRGQCLQRAAEDPGSRPTCQERLQHHQQTEPRHCQSDHTTFWCELHPSYTAKLLVSGRGNNNAPLPVAFLNSGTLSEMFCHMKNVLNRMICCCPSGHSLQCLILWLWLVWRLYHCTS